MAGTQRLAEVQPGAVRQGHVQQDEVGQNLFHREPRRPEGVRPVHREPVRFQLRLIPTAALGAAVHQQDTRLGHAMSSFPPSSF